MFSNTTKKPLAFASLIAATVVAMSVTAIALAGSESKVRRVHGAFTSDAPFSGPNCPSPIDLCATATFKGSIHGPATAVATSVTPTAQPGVVAGIADIVIHDPRGDVRCTESFVLNGSPDGDSEEGWICEITGGTGHFANVIGHIEAFGSSAGGDGVVRGTYEGKLTFP
jgi:hypothetical protein